jgi:hypothetical protein
MKEWDVPRETAGRRAPKRIGRSASTTRSLVGGELHAEADRIPVTPRVEAAEDDGSIE